MDALDSKYSRTIPISHVDEVRHSFPTGWLALVIFLAIAFVILLVIYIRERSLLIDPSQCPTVKGDYAVLPAVNGHAKTLCGDDDNQKCILPAVTLEQAINNCNFRSDICTMFSFDEVSGTMTIINPRNLSVDTKTNVYIRQVGVSARS